MPTLRSRLVRAQPDHAEDGYALITAVTITMILSLLLTLIVAQALHSNLASSQGVRRNQALATAEAGVNWAIAALQADRTAALVTDKAVPVAGATQSGPALDQVGDGTAWVTVTAGTPTSPGRPGYYTIASTGQIGTSGSTRTIRVVLGPAPSFTAALHATASLTVQQNACIIGTIYSQGDIFFKGNATIAGTSTVRGSLISAQGVIKDFSPANHPTCPATLDDEPVDVSYDVHGDVLAGGGQPAACRSAPAGAVSDPVNGFNLNGATVRGRICTVPPLMPMPAYTFDPGLYPEVEYYGRPPGHGAASTTAVSDFNTALQAGTLPQASGGGLDRTYVVWQDLTASSATNTTPAALRLDTNTLRIAGDSVIYTNVPVDFGNTTSVQAAGPCSTATPPPAGAAACPTFQVISAYAGTPCTGGAGGCPSIYGGNKIQFRPEVAVLLYSQDGAIKLQNDCNGPSCNESNQGSFYASSIDAKNNLNIAYTPRIAHALGFGPTALEQHSWQELPPCPRGQASC
jgi:hypothetical protein